MDFWEIYDRYYARVRGYAASMLRDAAAATTWCRRRSCARSPTSKAARAGQGGGLAVSGRSQSLHGRCAPGRRPASTRRPTSRRRERRASRRASQSELERGEMSACVRDQVDQLPETDRSVILLCDIAGLSQDEIADVLGIEVGAVKVRLHRARKKLRAVLESACSFERDDRNVLVCEPKRPER